MPPTPPSPEFPVGFLRAYADSIVAKRPLEVTDAPNYQDIGKRFAYATKVAVLKNSEEGASEDCDGVLGGVVSSMIECANAVNGDKPLTAEAHDELHKNDQNEVLEKLNKLEAMMRKQEAMVLNDRARRHNAWALSAAGAAGKLKPLAREAAQQQGEEGPKPGDLPASVGVMFPSTGGDVLGLSEHQLHQLADFYEEQWSGQTHGDKLEAFRWFISH